MHGEVSSRGLAISLESNGDTLLTDFVPDQAALHGVPKRVRDLGIPLISVHPVATDPDRRQEGSA
jgi:hypothetical protein